MAPRSTRCNADKTLVVGYGNDLRADDGAGRVVAERIADLDLPGVTVRSQSQLTPELSLEIAQVDRVVFVDASLDVAETTLERMTFSPGADPAWSHHSTPEKLLAMTSSIGDVPKNAYTVSIPVADLGIGLELSPITAAAVQRAVHLISDLICE